MPLLFLLSACASKPADTGLSLADTEGCRQRVARALGESGQHGKFRAQLICEAAAVSDNPQAVVDEALDRALPAENYRYPASGEDAAGAAKDAKRIYEEFLKADLDYGDFSVEKSNARVGGESKKALPRGARKKYLSESEMVPSGHPFIRELAKLITHDARSDAEKAYFIHNFLVWNLTHGARFGEKYGTPESLGSKKAKILDCLKNDDSAKKLRQCGISVNISFPKNSPLGFYYAGSHNCFGYGAGFTALARAAGLPSKLIMSTMPNTFHIWSQVYINGKWWVVDPTGDDRSDQGSYDERSQMKVLFDFFLVTPKRAAALTWQHKKYEESGY